jgi:hypothetical protein
MWPKAVTIVTGLHPIAFVGGQPGVKDVIVLLIRFRTLLPLAAIFLGWRARLAMSLRLLSGDPRIAATFRRRDKCSGQVIGRCSVANDPPLVADAISDIQRSESSLREILHKLVQCKKATLRIKKGTLLTWAIALSNNVTRIVDSSGVARAVKTRQGT